MKKKLIILSVLLICLTGCSADYNLEIYNNQVKEDMQYINYDTSTWDSVVQYDLTYRELLTASVNYPYPVFDNTIVDENDTIKIEGIEYYDNKLISSNTTLGEQLKYNKFNLTNFQESSIVKKCYQYFNVIEQDDTIILSTSLENLCFKQYPMLDRITVNIKTNHKVVSSNATKSKKYKYTWDITRDNSSDSAIQMTIKKDEFIFNYENELIKKIVYIILIIGIILGVSSSIYFYVKKKNRYHNEI